MTTYAQLKISLHRLDGTNHEAVLQFLRPDSEEEKHPVRGRVVFDLAELRNNSYNTQDYGELLTDSLFQDDTLLQYYREARAVVDAGGIHLRIRLFIDTTSPELHALRWELLHDPISGQSLIGDERILFSRFIAGEDWRSIRLHPKSDLTALIAVAAGKDLPDWGLAEIGRDKEVTRAQNALGGANGIRTRVLDGPATLSSLSMALRQRTDILYLVCHGMLREDGEPIIYLQDDEGRVKGIPGQDLADRLQKLANPPLLTILISCESAGSEANPAELADPSAALAPRINRAGVPAVLAMQGKISMTTVDTFVPTFFRALMEDGQLDRAISIARGAVFDRSDHWMPALFLRLKSGRLWYNAGFSREFDRWDSLISSLEGGRCTPIIGTGLAEEIYGGNAWLAGQLTRKHSLPLSGNQGDDLATVSQYLSLKKDMHWARSEIQQQLREELLRRWEGELDESQRNLKTGKLLKQIAILSRQRPDDPYRILADLPCPLYITAEPDGLLRDAISAADRDPGTLLCAWKGQAELEEQEVLPSSDKPLVYHILGSYNDEDSLVLTEDDYFNYLIGTSLNKKMVPPAIRRAISDSALLFLGFRLTDWSFRVLFQLIMQQGGNQRLGQYTHIAVQVEPEEHTETSQAQAKHYLEKYFGNFDGMKNFNIYWGTAADFLKELEEQRRLRPIPIVWSEDEEDDDEW